MAVDTEDAYARNTCIDITYTMDRQIRCFSIGNVSTRNIYVRNASVKDIEPRALTRSGVI